MLLAKAYFLTSVQIAIRATKALGINVSKNFRSAILAHPFNHRATTRNACNRCFKYSTCFDNHKKMNTQISRDKTVCKVLNIFDVCN